MGPTIRVDDEVWDWLKEHARPLEDTPNSVLRRIAGLDGETDGRSGATDDDVKGTRRRRRLREGHTPREEFRRPLLELLHRRGGQMDRQSALRELENVMKDRLTTADLSDIESGTVRWEKTAEWEVFRMRQKGLLEPVSRSGQGVWKLTTHGASEAARIQQA